MQRNKEEENRYRQLLPLTSLTTREFMALLAEFDKLWQAYHLNHDLKGEARMITKFQEHAYISLRGSQEKLLFILVYLQQNPTQAYHGVIFSMSQGKVSQWLKLLLPLLEKSLHRLKMLPQKNADAFYLSLKVLAEYFILLDGTERAIPRPVDYERQKLYYSGKKGEHTVKNNLIINKEQQILYLSDTVEGSMHDKALADEMQLSFPAGGVLMQDLGFLGYAPDKVKVVMPEKKPKGQQLSSEDKAFNQLVSSMRVTVEHAISGIKRLRIVQDKIRLRIEDIHDRVMLIACGLHNLRIRYRNLP
jgi:hypothetical protein